MDDPDDNAWRVLYIDDDEDDYVLTREMLKQAQGRKIILDWVSTYQAGQGRLQSSSYDAVLVDYDLGPYTGVELIRAAASQEYRAPLILFTGRGSYAIDLEAMRAGATLYLTKDEANPLLLERAIRYAIKLKRLEQERTDILESIQDGFFTLDQNWNITYINRQAALTCGFEPEELIGHNVWDASPGLLGAPYEQHYRRAMQERRAMQFEMHNAGQGRWNMVSVYPSHDGISVYWQDNTERKQAEEALSESEEMLRLALTAGQAGAWNWNLETNALHWSDECFHILDIEPGSVQPSAEAGFSRVHPDDRLRVEALMRRTIAHGTHIDEVLRIIWLDGSQHWVRAISQAFFHTPGKPYRVAGIVIDITQQKQAELEIHAAHRRAVEILESISDAFYSLDQQGCFTYVNHKAASLWKSQPADLLGKNIWEVFPAGKETESFRKIQQALVERKPMRYESYSALLNQWVDIHLYPTEQGISVYFQDITERKSLESKDR